MIRLILVGASTLAIQCSKTCALRLRLKILTTLFASTGDTSTRTAPWRWSFADWRAAVIQLVRAGRGTIMETRATWDHLRTGILKENGLYNFYHHLKHCHNIREADVCVLYTWDSPGL